MKKNISIFADYISDIHLETYISLDKDKEAFFKSLDIISNILYKPFHKCGKVLILAGDISSSINQIKWFVEYVSSYYEKIFYVHGNHEMYVLHGDNSLTKIEILKRELNNIDNCIFLDGQVIEFEGIKFGGCSMFYDFSYGINHFGLNETQMKFLWKKNIRDSFMINDGITKDYYVKQETGQFINILFDPISFFNKEKEKLEKLKECDVIISHVMPFVHKFYPKKYHNAETGFFMFDGEEFISKSKVKYWFAGHTHTLTDAKKFGVRLLINPYGYPNENCEKFVRQIEIKL